MKKSIYGILIVVILILMVILIQRINNGNNGVYTNEDTAINEQDRKGYSIDNVRQEDKVYVTDALGTGMEIEILSCELVDDSNIADSKYQSGYFSGNKYPEYPCYEGYLDTDALAKENSEFAEYYKNPNAYDINKAIALFDENSELVDKYRKKKEVDYKYVFIDVRITFENINSKTTEASLSEIECVVATTDGVYMSENSDNICYFDKSENIEGDLRVHKFFWYDFSLNNTLECTIGFKVEDMEKYGACEYFIGDKDNLVKIIFE